MVDAASRIENPQGRLYKAIVSFRKNAKKPKFRAAWGKVYSFRYHAKYEKVLPYYDRYPMVLVLSSNKKNKTFDGLNLHYVNPYFRTLLLRGIMHLHMAGPDRFVVKEFKDSVTRLVKRIMKPCVHRYRIDRVMNYRYIQIPGLIPPHLNSVHDQTFMKASYQRAWMDSTKAIISGAKWKLKMENKRKAAKAAARHTAAQAKRKAAGQKVKARSGNPERKSKTAKSSKAKTGKKYTDKGPKRTRRKRK